jgi:hypothetical protein
MEHRPDASLESYRDRDRTLEAMHTLETAVGRAASLKDADDRWKVSVSSALKQLELALADQFSSYDAPTSLMSEIARDDPRLRTFVRQLHHRWHDLAQTATTLRAQLDREQSADAWTIADMREQTRWLMNALHHHRAREADLVFDALEIDLTKEQ